MNQLMHLLELGVSTHVVGGCDELLRLLYGVRDLQNDTPSDVPEFFGFSSWKEVLVAVKDDELPELVTLVNLVERFSVGRLIRAVKSTTNEESAAKVSLSTVHKAKGREWNRVHLTDDSLLTGEGADDGKSTVPMEEKRVAYVAVTRAKQALNVPPTIRQAFGIWQDERFDEEYANSSSPQHNKQFSHSK